MSTNIPRAGEVDKAIKAVQQKVKAAQTALNQNAAKQMSRSKYSVAEAMIGKGREIEAFLKDVQALRQRWRGLRGRGEAAEKNSKTPLWGYYQPVLQAIVQLEGSAKRRDLTPVVEEIMGGSFKEGDLDEMAGGWIRWQVMIRRTRKALVEQGWLEEYPASPWVITPEGRKAAESSAENSHKLT